MWRGSDREVTQKGREIGRETDRKGTLINKE